jgi:hypothetical protein
MTQLAPVQLCGPKHGLRQGKAASNMHEDESKPELGISLAGGAPDKAATFGRISQILTKPPAKNFPFLRQRVVLHDPIVTEQATNVKLLG